MASFDMARLCVWPWPAATAAAKKAAKEWHAAVPAGAAPEGGWAAGIAQRLVGRVYQMSLFSHRMPFNSGIEGSRCVDDVI
jgi:hypothetical protein